jgi:hypothetical protein
MKLIIQIYIDDHLNAQNTYLFVILFVIFTMEVLIQRSNNMQKGYFIFLIEPNCKINIFLIDLIDMN